MDSTFSKFFVAFALIFSSIAHAGVVIESTRYLYKEGAREISAQIDNNDEIPYLIKSWVESSSNSTPEFMVTPPLFRLEAKQKNTVRLFSTGAIKAPADRESIFYFNIMAIPPTDDIHAKSNTIQLAVRHRMRLVYRPKQLFDKSSNTEAQYLKWSKSGQTITLKNDTPFFYYFNTIKIGDKEIKNEISSIQPFSTKKVNLKEKNSATKISWKIVNDYGGAGTHYTSSL